MPGLAPLREALAKHSPRLMYRRGGSWCRWSRRRRCAKPRKRRASFKAMCQSSGRRCSPPPHNQRTSHDRQPKNHPYQAIVRCPRPVVAQRHVWLGNRRQQRMRHAKQRQLPASEATTTKGHTMTPTPPCTIAAKHKWQWIKNGTKTTATSSMGGTSVRMTLKGLYKCACGAKRIGQPNHNAKDLRDLVGQDTP